ncbi:MAG: DUF4115 domain-containing protein [Deltaproteobacteria bacterium]|nr:DUF4115 domain-containing protein [Deltaproteobacteria bacterium]
MAEKTHNDSSSLESLGQLLTAEREKAGFTRNELASKTRIAIDEIAKMEGGQFSHVPPVYARGFLKTLAGALNLDPETFLSEYRRLSGHKEAAVSKPLQNKYVESDILVESGSSLSVGALIVLTILLAGVVLFFLNPTFHGLVTEYLPFLNNPPSSPAPSRSSAPSPPRPLSSVAPTSETGSDLAPTNPTAGANPGGGRLILQAVKASWAQIMVDEGALKFVYFQPGQSQTYDSAKSISLIAGDGQALRAEWNGQDLGFLGPQGPLELVFPLPR